MGQVAFTLASHLEPQQCLGCCGLLPITGGGGRLAARGSNGAMPERRFPPPWSADEAALPSSPDRNVDNGRGQGIPEAGATNLQGPKSVERRLCR